MALLYKELGELVSCMNLFLILILINKVFFKTTATIVSSFYLFVLIWLKTVYKLHLTERMYLTPLYINN